MSLVIPDEVVKASGLSEADLMLEIIMLFGQKKISIGKSSYLAKMPLIQFQHALAQRKIPIHYDVADFEVDIETLEQNGTTVIVVNNTSQITNLAAVGQHSRILGWGNTL